jgi:hypothetical protein
VAHLMDGSVCLTDVKSGVTRRITERVADSGTLRPEACVVSPDGLQVAYVRSVAERDGSTFNQIWVAQIC